MNVDEVRNLVLTGLSHTLEPQAIENLALAAAQGPLKFTQEFINYGVGYTLDGANMMAKGVELLGEEVEQHRLDVKHEQEWKEFDARWKGEEQQLEEKQRAEAQGLEDLDLEPSQRAEMQMQMKYKHAAEWEKLKQDRDHERESILQVQALQDQRQAEKVQQSLDNGWDLSR